MINRDFKGVWIPKEVYLDKRLTALDKIILIEIDSLDNGDEKGCFASNEYLAEFCQCSISKVTKSISKLKELGYIRVIGTDGRKRFLRSCIIKNNFQTNKKYEADQYNLLHNNITNNIDYREVDNNQTRPEKHKEITELTIEELKQLKHLVLENRDTQTISYREIQKKFNLIDPVTYDTPTICSKLIKQTQDTIRRINSTERCTGFSEEVF